MRKILLHATVFIITSLALMALLGNMAHGNVTWEKWLASLALLIAATHAAWQLRNGPLFCKHKRKRFIVKDYQERCYIYHCPTCQQDVYEDF